MTTRKAPSGRSGGGNGTLATPGSTRTTRSNKITMKAAKSPSSVGVRGGAAPKKITDDEGGATMTATATPATPAIKMEEDAPAKLSAIKMEISEEETIPAISSSLTPSLAQSKISEDNFFPSSSSPGTTIAAGNKNDGDRADVVAKNAGDPAEAHQQRRMSDENDNRAVEVKIQMETTAEMKMETVEVEIKMETDEKEEGEGSSPATDMDLEAPSLPLTQNGKEAVIPVTGERPPTKKEGAAPLKVKAPPQKDEIIAGSSTGTGGGIIDSSDISAVANKLTGVSTTTTDAPSSAATAIAAGVAPNDGGDDGGFKNKTVGADGNSQPSFSMTLAIGPDDAQRVFRASRAFNVELQRLRRIDLEREEQEARRRKKEKSKRSTGGGGNSEADGAQAAASKKNNVPEIVHSPPSREEENATLPDAKTSQLPPAGTSLPAKVVATASSSSDAPAPHPPSDPPPRTSPPPASSSSGPRPLRDLLIPAAEGIDDPLMSSFLSRMESHKRTREERQISLLFFLDADKSAKLLAAFDALGRNDAAAAERGTETGRNTEAERDDDDDGASRLVGRSGLIRLFRSFLTSISTCVHGEDQGMTEAGGGGGAADGIRGGDAKSSGADSAAPTAQNAAASASKMNEKKGENDHENNGDDNGDWKGSDRTLEEILEVATFAADNLIEFARKKESSDGNVREERRRPAENNAGAGAGSGGGGASFDIFGEWYNSGGFSLVPWLELLDLSKWDYAGNADDDANPENAESSTGGVGSEQQQRRLPPSSSKRARLHGADNNTVPLTPGAAGMNEPIGSPSALFASGAMLGATPQPPRKTGRAEAATGLEGSFEPGVVSAGGVRSFSATFGEMGESRTVVSFDFSGSSPAATGDPNSRRGADRGGENAFHIDITEENLVMLRNLVRRTGFAQLQPNHVEALMMKHARVERHKYGETVYVISRKQFGRFIREVVPKQSSKGFDPTEIENFSNYFTNFFTCFDYSWSELKKDEVNAKELMVGFSFLFAGNKSSKLAAAYDMLDADNTGYLTQRGLMQYLRSYLTMLAGISLLSANKTTTTQIRKRLLSPNQRDDAFLAVENGAKWTLSHFLRAFEKEHCSSDRRSRNSTRSNAVTFEDFAKWYTDGGYAVAPWLELLDLQKFLSLIGEDVNAVGEARPPAEEQSLAEVLFTFPLAKDRSLVVLRDDALYVRSVVNELGLLSLTSEDIWSVLFNDVAKSIATQPVTAGGDRGRKPKKSFGMEVDKSTFVQCMMRILSGTGNIQQHAERTEFSPEETLNNFFLSFDLAQKKRVALNQLMCGLTLLCGGKKSNKLVFAFGLFGSEDAGKGGGSKKKASMTHDDFFFFFRSFLIVMFSCCNQSLSLSADAVTQYISDTAREVADDVMKYWKEKKVDKVRFENFSEWYNEGGFETAPWLELLDLNKWVLADQNSPGQQQQTQQEQHPPTQQHPPTEEPVTQQLQPPAPQHQQIPVAPMTPAPTKPLAASSYTPGLTPGHEMIRALLASPKMKPNGSSPDCPPPPPDDDPLFDLDMSAVDAEVDEMDFILQEHESSAVSQNHTENVNYLDPAMHTEVAVGHGADSPSRVIHAEPQIFKFNLLTQDQFGGYMISIGPNQVQLLHRIVTETGLWQIDAPTICKFILYDSKSRRTENLSKKSFQSAMKRVFEYTSRSLLAPVHPSTQEELSAFTDKLFASFDRPRASKSGKINAVELACGFTVLCGGRKSDKLEHVFELLDEDKDGLVSRRDITRFIQSFLIMLMSVSTSFTHLYGQPCGNDSTDISRAIDAGSEWATTQVFNALQQTRPPIENGGNATDVICFDDFADWYTKGGYQSMSWLELLDLRKWVLGES